MRDLILWFILGFLTACGASPSNTGPQPASTPTNAAPADSRPLNEQTNIDRTKAVACRQSAGDPSNVWSVNNYPPFPDSDLYKCCNNIYIILGGSVPMQLNDDNTVTPLVETLNEFWTGNQGCFVAISNKPKG